MARVYGLDNNRRRRCFAGRCRHYRMEGHPFCEDHAAQVPEDLVARIEWAYDEGEAIDREAALRAVQEYLNDGGA